MKIDVSEIIGEPGASISFAVTGAVELGADGQDDIEALAPFEVKGVATSTGEGVYVQANVKGTVRLTCSRCLADFEMPIEFSCEAGFVDSPVSQEGGEEDDDDVETYPLSNGYCILDELVRNGVILNIPMKPLCDPECKGLCPVCGANLNETQCQCAGLQGQATLFGRKLLEALEERGSENGSSEKKDIQG